uniref:Uncharacterized protein n=1 Tax=Arundo donax TaxID=35708 RepID=A0A0A9EXQ1_ARUDO
MSAAAPCPSLSSASILRATAGPQQLPPPALGARRHVLSFGNLHLRRMELSTKTFGTF